MQHDLELIIDEAAKGHFYWVIFARAAATAKATVIDFAKGPSPSHQAALDAGATALRLHRSLKHDSHAPSSRFRADSFADTVPADLL
jgi:hypothetical protein